MSDSQGQPRVPFFEVAQVGQRPSASEHNKLTEAVRRSLATLHIGERHIGLEMYRVSGRPVGVDQTDVLAFRRRTVITQKDGGIKDASGNDLSLNDSDTTDRINNARSSSRTVYDVGERPPGFYHRQSGTVELLNPRFTRNAITVRSGGEYPRCGSNKFPIKFVRREYVKQDGQEIPRVIYLDSQNESPGSESPDAWVFVQCDDDGISDYIPEGNVIECFDNIGLDGQPQWHSNTVYGGTTVIRIPDGGIPEGTMDAPGSAYCPVYRLIGEDGNKRYERVYRPTRSLEPVFASSASSNAADPYGSSASGDGLFVWVYNISFVRITGTWGKPSRDRCGDWLIDCPCSPVSSSSPSSLSSGLSSESSPLSSDSSEPSSSDRSSSEPSEPSEPSIPSEPSEPSEPSQPSVSQSGSSTPSVSSLPSEPSEPSQPSQPPPSEPPQSDKSTAIVPASWMKTGFTALFELEAPEVRFDDVLAVVVTDVVTDIEIDPRYVEVCEPETIVCCGCNSIGDAMVNAFVVENDGVKKLRIILLDDDHREVVVVARLTAIRKGFLGKRFPPRTRSQFDQNENRLKKNYRPYGDDEGRPWWKIF